MKKLQEWMDYWDAAIVQGAELHQESMVHKLAFFELAAHLHKIRTAVDEDDIEKAVLWSYKFGHKMTNWEGIIQRPTIEKKVRSVGGKKAADDRHNKNWPTDKLKALKREYLELRKTLKHWTACRELAKEIFKEKDKGKIKTYSRRIDRQITIMKISA